MALKIEPWQADLQTILPVSLEQFINLFLLTKWYEMCREKKKCVGLGVAFLASNSVAVGVETDWSFKKNTGFHLH